MAITTQLNASGAKPTDPPDERRKTPRNPEQCSASVLLPDRRRIKGKTVDLSSEGVCLTLPEALTLGHQYRFRIDRRIDNKKQRIDVIGRVCFCISLGGQFRIGMHCPDLACYPAQS